MAPRLPPITIIGAGLSGLTLSLSLKRLGIASTIFERAASPPSHNYGITIPKSNPLLQLLKLDQQTFVRRLAVDAHLGGKGRIPGNEASFRCHRGKLEGLLREGLDVRFGRKLSEVGINGKDESARITAVLEDGSKESSGLLVGCDGVHSIVRQTVAPQAELEVLPYVVYNGKRRMSTKEYMETIHPSMDGYAILHKQTGRTRLEVSVADIASDRTEVSYVYSRPVTDVDDALFNPDRPITGAEDIPEAFFQELAALGDLEMPFRALFDHEKTRGDRVLNWLMRVVKMEERVFEDAAGKGVVLIGDAGYAMPIVGGQGALVAIEGAVELAECIGRSGVEGLRGFGEENGRRWRAVGEGKREVLREMHAVDSASS